MSRKWWPSREAWEPSERTQGRAGTQCTEGAEGQQNLPEPGGHSVRTADTVHGKLSPVVSNGELGGPAHPKQSEPLSSESPRRPLLITAILTIMPKAPSFLDIFFSHLTFIIQPSKTEIIILTLTKEKLRLGEVELPHMTQPGLAQGSPTTQPILPR